MPEYATLSFKTISATIEIQGFIIDPNLSKKLNKQQAIANYC
jgi:hypothetical protein